LNLGGIILAFANLKQLRNNMVANEIAVFSTVYAYNGVNCYIAYCLLTANDKKLDKYKYALLRMRFIKRDDFDQYVDCPANSNGIDVKYGELRQFFNIKFDPNGTKEWYNALINNIGDSIMSDIPMQNNELYNVSINTVCRHENRDPNRIYRSHLLRHFVDNNGKGKCRTEYNAQLAALKFPRLYNLYRTDKHVSFAFIDKAEQEVSEQVAYDRFIAIEQNRKKVKIND